MRGKKKKKKNREAREKRKEEKPGVPPFPLPNTLPGEDTNARRKKIRKDWCPFPHAL